MERNQIANIKNMIDQIKGKRPDSPYLDKEMKHKGFEMVVESSNASNSFDSQSFLNDISQSSASKEVLPLKKQKTDMNNA